MAKHPEVTVSDFQRFAYRFENAEVYLDRKDRHVILFMDDGYWWRAVVKGTAIGELYVQTYHRTNARQIAKAKGRDKRVL